MSIESQFEAKLAESWPAEQWRDMTVVLAVSGGADSIALLRAMLSIQEEGAGQIVVAHFNHKLRGAASDADEQFVVQMCRNLKIGCDVSSSERPIEVEAGEGLESTLRNVRYGFFKACATRHSARHVATAHTADDQAETILHRIIRGTSIDGLAGIPRARELTPVVTLIRPFLNFRRDEITEYLQTIEQPHREDASNKDSRFTRNRIRTELIPHLAEDYNKKIIASLIRLGTLASEAQEEIESVVRALMDQVVIVESDEVTVDCSKLVMHSDFVQREVLRMIWRFMRWPEQAMSFEQWSRLSDIVANRLDNDGLTLQLPGQIRAQKKGGQLTLTRL